MMRILITLLLSLTFLNQLTAADCNEQAELNTIYTLLGNVKNDILGKVPQFCRLNQHEQLEEKIDPKEKALTQFVLALTKIKKSEKDVSPLRDKSLAQASLVFDTLKITILKKMWQLATENNRYNLLVASECSHIGLNRFPFATNQTTSKPIKKINESLQLKKIFSVCNSNEFNDIAPFVSQDILAESLLTLKDIFPQSFPNMVQELCLKIKSANQLDFKKDQYEDFNRFTPQIESSKKFTSWLNELLSRYNKDYFYDSYGEKIMAYKIKQKELEQIYEKQPNKKPVLYTSTLQIEKNKKGNYFLTKIPDAIKTNEHLNQSNIELAIDNEKFKIKTIYEETNSSNKEIEGVPYPDYPGFYIIKKNSSYFIRSGKNFKNKIIKMNISQKQKIKKIIEEPYQTIKGQKELETIYKLQQQVNGKELDFIADFFQINYKILKNKNGIFSLSDQPITPLFTKAQEKYYSAYAKKFNINGNVEPIPYKNEGVLIYDKTSGYNFLSRHLLDLTIIQKNELHLGGVIKSKYQDTGKPEKAELSQSEISALKNYSGYGHVGINDCLRTNICKKDDLKKIDKIVSALKKLKRSDSKNTQLLFRGVNWLSDSDRKALDSNSQDFVLEKGFMSTSANVEISKGFANFPRGTLFIIKTQSCVGISSLSTIEGEDEFLCPPGLKFNVKRKDPKSNIYILEEID